MVHYYERLNILAVPLKIAGSEQEFLVNSA